MSQKIGKITHPRPSNSSVTTPTMGISDRVEEELSRLWESGQEWILIFDNLLKHPGGKVSKGCKCDMCEMQKFQHNSAACSNITTNTVQVSSTSHQQQAPLPGNLEKSRSGATSPQTSEISGNLTLLYKSHSVFGYTHTPLPLEMSFQKIF